MDNQSEISTENLEVPESVSRVQNEIIHLNELIEKLTAMLKPVLIDNVLIPSEAKGKEKEFQCPLACDILEQARQIAVVNEQLATLIKQIQV